MAHQLLTARESAKHLNIGIATFYRWKKAGRLPTGVQLGQRAARWSVAELDEFIERQRAATASAA